MAAVVIFCRVSSLRCGFTKASPVKNGFYQLFAGRSLRSDFVLRQLHWTRACLHDSGQGRSAPAREASWISGDLLEQDDIVETISTSNSRRGRTGMARNEQYRPQDDSGSSLNPRECRKTLGTNSQGDRPTKRKGMEGEEIVFGVNPVLLALKQERRRFYRLFITEAKSLSQEPQVKEILQICQARSIPVARKQSAELHGLSTNRPHQGVCLDTTALNPDSLDIDALTADIRTDAKNRKLWLFLDSVMDPMNFGAIIRSAYFFGVDRIFIFNGCPLTSTVSKASAGIMEIMSICALDGSRHLKQFFTAMKEGKCSIVATCSKNELAEVSTQTRRTMRSLSADGNLLLVFGNENSGINNEILPFCDQVLCIEPGKDSLLEDANCLNVSVAAGVVLSHIALKRTSPATEGHSGRNFL